MILANISSLIRIDIFTVCSWRLINLQILSFNDETIGRDTCTSLKKDDIADNDVPDTDSLSGTEFASNDRNCFFFDIRWQFNVFFILDVIRDGNNGDQQNGNQDDGDAFSYLLQFPEEQGDDTREKCSGTNCNPKNILTCLNNGFENTCQRWRWSSVHTKYFLSSFQVLFVTNDARIWLWSKFLENALNFSVLLKLLHVKKVLLCNLENFL